jgi:hypothetical protein
MSASAHVEILVKKHEFLNSKIKKAYAEFYSDTELAELKKQRLRIRDEIKRLRPTG